MKGEVITVTVDNLVPMVKKMFEEGYRFVTASCVDLGETHDLIYHFDKDLNLVHLRLNVSKGTKIPSISPVYFCALLVENEIQDLFGIDFDGLVLDYGGKFVIGDDAPNTPFVKIEVTKVQTEKKEG